MNPEISAFVLGFAAGTFVTFVGVTLLIEWAKRKLDGPAVPNQRHANRR